MKKLIVAATIAASAIGLSGCAALGIQKPADCWPTCSKTPLPVPAVP